MQSLQTASPVYSVHYWQIYLCIVCLLVRISSSYILSPITNVHNIYINNICLEKQQETSVCGGAFKCPHKTYLYLIHKHLYIHNILGSVVITGIETKSLDIYLHIYIYITTNKLNIIFLECRRVISPSHFL